MEPSEDVTGTLYKQFFQPGEGDIHTVKDLLFLKYLPCAKNSAMPPAFISFHPYLPRDWIQSAPFKGVKAEALVGEVVWPSALIVSGRTRSETQTYPKPVFLPLHPPTRRRNHKEGDFGTVPRRGSRVLILTQQTCPLLEPWFPLLPKEGETRGSGRLFQNSCSGSPGSWVSPVLCSLPRHKVHRGELHQIKGS